MGTKTFRAGRGSAFFLSRCRRWTHRSKAGAPGTLLYIKNPRRGLRLRSVRRMSSRLFSVARRRVFTLPLTPARSVRTPFGRSITTAAGLYFQREPPSPPFGHPLGAAFTGLTRGFHSPPDPVSTAPAAKRAPFFLRAASVTGRIVLFTTLGFIMAAAPAYNAAAAILSPASDADTLDSFTPQDDDARAKEDYVNAHPLTASLRVNPDFTESRPHMKIPPSWRKHNLTGGTLSGPGKMAIPPFSWTERDGKNYVQITHVGTDLCGHQGIIHGGFLATMLDEGLARCCFPVLPFNVGMTAKLEINYKAPAMADQYLVLRATTVKVEGRKAWVEGHIETLPAEEGEVPTILATASALYISPKQAAVRSPEPHLWNPSSVLA